MGSFMLIDTNIWLELLLKQNKYPEVLTFLDKTQSDPLYTTEFTLYSISILLTRYKKYETLEDFINDVIINGNVILLKISPEEIPAIIKIADKYTLDFDDSYQYYISERENLVLVSYDSDFDRTPKGRKTPGQIITMT